MYFSKIIIKKKNQDWPEEHTYLPRYSEVSAALMILSLHKMSLRAMPRLEGHAKEDFQSISWLAFGASPFASVPSTSISTFGF